MTVNLCRRALPNAAQRKSHSLGLCPIGVAATNVMARRVDLVKFLQAGARSTARMAGELDLGRWPSLLPASASPVSAGGAAHHLRAGHPQEGGEYS